MEVNSQDIEWYQIRREKMARPSLHGWKSRLVLGCAFLLLVVVMWAMWMSFFFRG
jgi:hypothetical protein